MSSLIKTVSNQRCITYGLRLKLSVFTTHDFSVLKFPVEKIIDEVVKELHGIGRSLGVGLAP